MSANTPILIMDRASRMHGAGELTVHALSRVSLSVQPGELESPGPCVRAW